MTITIAQHNDVISGVVFYDNNTDGVLSNGETGVAGWTVYLYDSTGTHLVATTTTGANGAYRFTNLPTGDYIVTESTTPPSSLASLGNWVSTSAISQSVHLPYLANQKLQENFGNVALAGSTGALALGFWSNKNGQAIFNASTGSLTINGTTYANITDLQLTDVLNLVQADARTGLNGVQWDPANYAAFRSWLLSATAKDMAYMLSAQVVTTELDVFNNYVKAGAYIDVAAVSGVSLSILTTGVTINGTTYALAVDSAGFASIQSIMDAANAVLGAGSTADNTVGGSALRDYENALQTLLGAINNNQVLVVV